MSKTQWTANPALDATRRTYDSGTVTYDSAAVTYDGIDPTKIAPTLTAWTPATP